MTITGKLWMSMRRPPRITSTAAARASRVFLSLAACMAMLSGGIIPPSWAAYSRPYPAKPAGTSSFANFNDANSGRTESRPPALNGAQPISSTGSRAALALGRLPVTFEENQGQVDAGIKFISRTPNGSLLIGPNETTITVERHGSSSPEARRPSGNDPNPGLETMARSAKSAQVNAADFQSGVVRMNLLGASSNPLVEGLKRAQGTINYFVGHDSSKWRTGIPTYASVKESEVYPGIDMVYHGAAANPSQLEYDFVIAPGANASSINLGFEGASNIHLDKGDLVLETPAGDIRQVAPTAYQEVGSARQAVASRYEIKGKGRRSVAFRLGNYDHSLPLVIDPTLVYSTYFGGNGQAVINAVATDASGNAYFTGYANPAGLPPTSGAFSYVGTGQPNPFVTELDATGQQIVFTSYLGGSVDGFGNGIAVDWQGNVYVTGSTQSPDFPVTPGAFQSTLKTGDTVGAGNAFVSKLSPGGSKLIYSTFLGGSNAGPAPIPGAVQLPGTDSGTAIAVGATGIAYVGGTAVNYVDFPTTAGAFQPSTNTTTTFVSAINEKGTGLFYSTFLASSAGSAPVFLSGIALDSAGEAFISGSTYGSFPTTAGSFQPAKYGQSAQAPAQSPLAVDTALVAKLNAAGSDLVYATYIGDVTNANSIAVDAQGDACVTGVSSQSGDFPLVNALQTQFGSGLFQKSTDGGANFVTIDSGLNVNSPGSPVYSPTIDPSNPSNIYVVGTNGFFGGDALYKSTNAGASWSIVGNGLPEPTSFPVNGYTTGTIASITIDPTNSLNVYAGLEFNIDTDGFSLAVFKSVDGGNNFAELTTAAIGAISAINPQLATTMYAIQLEYGSDDTIVVESTDGGNTWNPSSQGLPETTVQTIAMDPTNPMTLYAGTRNGIFKTTNGGGQWAPTGLSSASAKTQHTSISINPHNPSTLYAISVDSSLTASGTGRGNPNKKAGQSDPPSGAVTSTDGGTTWSAINNGLPSSEELGLIEVDPVNSSNIYIGATQGLFKSSNGGQEWAFATAAGTADIGAFAIDPKTEGTIYVPSTPMGNAFVTKLSPSGSSAVFSTLLGGADQGLAIAVDPSANVYVTGSIAGTNLPITGGALQETNQSVGQVNNGNTFLAVFSPAGGLSFCTYFGGSDEDVPQGMAVDPNGDAIVVGRTSSSNFPLKQPIQANYIQSNYGYGTFVYEIAKIVKQSSGPASSLQVTAASITGKQLAVQGADFGMGAVIVVNGSNMATTNSSTAPSTSLISKKGGKQIARGQTVTIQVRNPDGAMSNGYSFTRPSN
jgi:hypothetical protein